MLIILTLTFIQGHRDLNHDYNKRFDYFRNNWSSAHAVTFEVQLKVYIMTIACPMTILFTQGHNCVSNFTLFLRCSINSNISDSIYAMALKLGMTVDLYMAYMLMLISMTLMQDHSGSAKAKKRWIIYTIKQAK